MNYLLHILVMIDIYVILALSLNLLVGYTGLVSLCHAAFYGIGAYVTTLLMMNLHVPFFIAMLIGVIGSAVLSMSISIPSLRLRGDYFVLASLGFQMIIFAILYNWVSVTRGPYGIPGIPRPSIFGFKIDTLLLFFIFTTVIMLICGVALYLIAESPFGRVLKAIREDEIATSAIGKSITYYKVVAFAIAGGFAAISGSLFSAYMQYIDPTSFTLMESIFILCIIIIGGTGNIVGPIVGAVVLIILPEALRFLRIPDAIAANMRQIIYGLLMLAILRYRPEGIAGGYRLQ